MCYCFSKKLILHRSSKKLLRVQKEGSSWIYERSRHRNLSCSIHNKHRQERLSCPRAYCTTQNIIGYTFERVFYEAGSCIFRIRPQEALLRCLICGSRDVQSRGSVQRTLILLPTGRHTLTHLLEQDSHQTHVPRGLKGILNFHLWAYILIVNCTIYIYLYDIAIHKNPATMRIEEKRVRGA